MGIKKILSHFSSGAFLYNKSLALACWFGLSFFQLINNISNHNNNYIIYRYSFYHAVNHTNLYIEYPNEYYDIFLYGPLFSVLMAPFALLSNFSGAICWIVANSIFLLFAIYKLPIKNGWKIALALLCSHELMITNMWFQSNAFVCACILLGFSYIQKEKEYAALFFILLAAFTKIYGIVGFSFFFFSKKPLHFLLWTAIWTIVLFLAPLSITSFSFLVQSYQDWVIALQAKSIRNNWINVGIANIYQNVSVIGMVRRIFSLSQAQMKDSIIMIPAALLFLSQYLQFRYFNDLRLRLYFLASILIFTVIFSNGAESPTYIIVLPGMCLWYLLQPKTLNTNIFFITIFILTTFAYTDILGSWSRAHLFRPYSLKALPPFILWIVILVQIHRKQFLKALSPLEKEIPKYATT